MKINTILALIGVVIAVVLLVFNHAGALAILIVAVILIGVAYLVAPN